MNRDSLPLPLSDPAYPAPPPQLFYKNGQPFPAHRPVGLKVNITHVELALDIPVTQEVLQEPEANVVKVAFTVRKAGRYEVAVKLGGLSVAYSPYYKIFQPGTTRASAFYGLEISTSLYFIGKAICCGNLWLSAVSSHTDTPLMLFSLLNNHPISRLPQDHWVGT